MFLYQGGFMGLWSRFTNIFKAKASRALDKAENPAETLDYSYNQQLEMLQKVKRGVADVVTAKKRLEIQTAKLEQTVVKLDSQARQALAANREDLARVALERKTVVQQQLQGLDQQIADLSGQQEQLISQERALAARVDSFRTQKEVIKAQYSAAEAQVRISEATSGLSDQLSDMGNAVQRAQDKTEQLQARAAAMDELVTSGAIDDLTAPGSNELDRQIAAISAGNQVDAEIAKLRAELTPAGTAGEISSGEPAAEQEAVEAPPEPAREGGEPGSSSGS
jgi:phage shock protein A